MLATLCRHGERWDEASSELDELDRLEAARKWKRRDPPRTRSNSETVKAFSIRKRRLTIQKTKTLPRSKANT